MIPWTAPSFHAAAEPILPAQLLDAAPKVATNERQFVAAQMRAMFVNQRRASATGHKLFQDPVNVGARDPARQFAVAEASRTSFAKQVIILRIVSTATIEFTYCGNTQFDRLTTFENQRAIALQRQIVPCEQPGRTGSHNDWAFGHWLGARVRIVESRRINNTNGFVVDQFDEGVRVGQVHPGRVDKFQPVAPARVKTLAQYPPRTDVARQHA